MKVIILAGGGGSRLFPLSRASMPKQFLTLGYDKSLLAQTVSRFSAFAKPQDIIIVTNKEYYHHVKTEITASGATGAHILLEPAARNTAPAICLAVRFCLRELGTDENEILFVTPADHIISPANIFSQDMHQAISLAKENKIVTFGIKPTSPETGYGYIQSGAKFQSGYIAENFREKPDLETAEKYLKEGDYYWNSGMFAFSVNCFKQELQTHQPEMHDIFFNDIPDKEVLTDFISLSGISIDYAIAEKSKNVVVLPMTANWNDIGSWDAIYDVLEKDTGGNAIYGDCIPVECSNTLMLGHNRLIAGIGLEDVLVVETDDVILVAKRGESQRVKDVVAELKKTGRKEVDEHTTMYRPWGYFTVLGEGPGYKMKKISVNPGQSSSLQMHYHRSEHWIVISGTARVTIGDKEQMVHENESVFVPPSTIHRLENPGRIPLEIIEVQNGRYLKEDDIIRFEDDYGRAQILKEE
jgi:mannose-1-phosphate guanylyltransferase/mannose-6-phosphate isomerase